MKVLTKIGWQNQTRAKSGPETPQAAEFMLHNCKLETTIQAHPYLTIFWLEV